MALFWQREMQRKMVFFLGATSRFFTNPAVFAKKNQFMILFREIFNK